MLLRSLRLKNILSFRDAEIELGPLNILIGANASGKSNLIETLALLRETPGDLAGFFPRNGSIGSWIWKGKAAESDPTPEVAEIAAVFGDSWEWEDCGAEKDNLAYNLRFAKRDGRFGIVGEKLETVGPDKGNGRSPRPHFVVEDGQAYVYPSGAGGGADGVKLPGCDSSRLARSAFSYLRDPVSYPEITRIADWLPRIRIYRNWYVGKDSPTRRPQSTDAASDFLEEDLSNLALVVKDLQSRGLGDEIDKHLYDLYEHHKSLHTQMYGGFVHLEATERGMSGPAPAARMSDGTMRLIGLLAVLRHPDPPGLICIEAPELDMHPEATLLLASLLRAASARTQIIVTTHSEGIMDYFTGEPEIVFVLDRGFFDDETEIKQLCRDDLEIWLERYRLGRLWEKGLIGGNRW